MYSPPRRAEGDLQVRAAHRVCQMLAVRWVVVRCVMYLVRLLNHQISIHQWGHSVIWWSKQVHYTSHNNPFDNRHLALVWRLSACQPTLMGKDQLAEGNITLPAHFPFFCAASASVTRAPRRMVENCRIHVPCFSRPVRRFFLLLPATWGVRRLRARR